MLDAHDSSEAAQDSGRLGQPRSRRTAASTDWRTRPGDSSPPQPAFRYQGWGSRWDTLHRARHHFREIRSFRSVGARGARSRSSSLYPHHQQCSAPQAPETRARLDTRSARHHHHTTIPSGYFYGPAQTPNNTTEPPSHRDFDRTGALQSIRAIACRVSCVTHHSLDRSKLGREGSVLEPPAPELGRPQVDVQARLVFSKSCSMHHSDPCCRATTPP